MTDKKRISKMKKWLKSKALNYLGLTDIHNNIHDLEARINDKLERLQVSAVDFGHCDTMVIVATRIRGKDQVQIYNVDSDLLDVKAHMGWLKQVQATSHEPRYFDAPPNFDKNWLK